MGAREVEITAAVDREVSVDGDRGVGEPTGHAAVAAPTSPGAARRRAAAGLDEAMADEVAASIPDIARRGASPRRLRDALAAGWPTWPHPIATIARAEVFIGPPGAGKTTTIAKIAAQERARGGQRLGPARGRRLPHRRRRAAADLRRHSRRAVRVARTADDLHALLDQRHRTPVLVDTAGRSPSDSAAAICFAWSREAPDVRTHLVLPASTSAAPARRILDGYAEARPSRLVLTKLDEAESLSPLVSVLHDWQLPISYLGTGQRVPEDLNRATPELLAASVLGESAPFAASLS